ncbi:hypothetical protein LJC48_07275 [Desulfovibrio sp. OttesenSCG-928-C06]|nr:hypothetical protein [Desulfovibrio sp. OttesenSCG-928-C06]
MIIFLQDIGLSILIFFVCLGAVAAVLALSAMQHNKTQTDDEKRLNPIKEAKGVFSAPYNLVITGFAAMFSLYAAETMAAMVIIGLCFLIVLFKYFSSRS